MARARPEPARARCPRWPRPGRTSRADAVRGLSASRRSAAGTPSTSCVSSTTQRWKSGTSVSERRPCRAPLSRTIVPVSAIATAHPVIVPSIASSSRTPGPTSVTDSTPSGSQDGGEIGRNHDPCDAVRTAQVSDHGRQVVPRHDSRRRHRSPRPARRIDRLFPGLAFSIVPGNQHVLRSLLAGDVVEARRILARISSRAALTARSTTRGRSAKRPDGGRGCRSSPEAREVPDATAAHEGPTEQASEPLSPSQATIRPNAQASMHALAREGGASETIRPRRWMSTSGMSILTGRTS